MYARLLLLRKLLLVCCQKLQYGTHVATTIRYVPTQTPRPTADATSVSIVVPGPSGKNEFYFYTTSQSATWFKKGIINRNVIV